MKKTSSFLLVIAMLLTMLVSSFTLGVTAAEISGTGYTATTDSTGAVASFVKDGTTYYVKSFAEALAVGCEANNGVTEINMIANQTITLSSAQAIVAIANKSFTLKGNGTKLTDNGTFANSTCFIQIKGSSVNTNVTLDGFTIQMATGSNNVRSLDVGDKDQSAPVTVTLKNTSVLENRKSYQTIIVGKDSKLVLDENTVVKHETKNLWNSESHAIMISNNGAIEVNNNATVIGYTRAIYPNNATTMSVLVDGGTVTATAGAAITSPGIVTVNGGTVTATAGDAITSTGTLTVSGGTISGSSSGAVVKGTATINGGTFITGGLAAFVVEGGTATINGGTFKTSSDNVALKYGWGVVTARNSGNITINDGHFSYPKAGVQNSDGKGSILAVYDNGKITLNGGTFCNAVGDNGNVRVMNGTNTIDFTCLSTDEGASVRTVADEEGIRFISTIPASAISTANAIKKSGTEITYGTIIAPYAYVQKAGGIFTMKALDEFNTDVAEGKRYVNVVANEGVKTEANGDVTVRAALVNLDESNFTRDFAAISYISYQTANGTVIIYGKFDAEKNVRNMREIAYEALADVKTEANTEYGNAVTSWYEYNKTSGEWQVKTGTAYSCYSNAQLEVIKNYLPKNS